MMVSRPPSPALAPFVQSLWFYESAHAHPREVVLPNGRMQLLVNLEAGSAVVRGLGTKPVVIDPGQMRRVVGVLFHPVGSYPLTGVSALELQDGGALVQDVLPNHTAELTDALTPPLAPAQLLAALDAWLLARCSAATPELRTLAAATRYLEAGLPVASAVEHAGTSRSTLLRAFGTHVGATPKLYARLHRFQRVVRALAGGQDDLAELATRVGYTDQAHLCHEFRAFAERTPTAYRPRSATEPNHVVV